MELRMYGLVNYQLTGIQMGIQFSHAVVEYGQSVKHSDDLIYELRKYDDWADNHKTYIILNGGTTNLNPDRIGTLNQHLISLSDNGIFCSYFHEPDLGDQLTSVCFIVDERVFNREKYPDFDTKIYQGDFSDPMNPSFLLDNRGLLQMPGHTIINKLEWDKWVESIGGRRNLFLRNFLRSFRLA